MRPFTDQFWMVVNVSDTESGLYSWEDDKTLPANRRPKHLHVTQESAEEEALRLHRMALARVTGESMPYELRFAVVKAVCFTEPLPRGHVRLTNYGAEVPLEIPERAKKKKGKRP